MVFLQFSHGIQGKLSPLGIKIGIASYRLSHFRVRLNLLNFLKEFSVLKFVLLNNFSCYHLKSIITKKLRKEKL
uniref:Uncharacterized protein n=1 Tax=Podoviridae sp. ctoqT5 TaxID=2826577 RepID=A0A8S5MPG1_9CAUD|nr:MAG TPA: hypothetical protein [Podoviridae sp. ctoqT5]